MTSEQPDFSSFSEKPVVPDLHSMPEKKRRKRYPGPYEEAEIVPDTQSSGGGRDAVSEKVRTGEDTSKTERKTRTRKQKPVKPDLSAMLASIRKIDEKEKQTSSAQKRKLAQPREDAMVDDMPKEEENHTKFGTHFYAGATLRPLEAAQKEDQNFHASSSRNINIMPEEVSHTNTQSADQNITEEVKLESENKESKEKAEEDFDRLSKAYEKRGLGEIAAQLSALPEFQNLPEGQKLLVMQSVSDKLLDHVRKEGDNGFRQEFKESGLFKKVWKGMTKNAIQARHEQRALASLAGKDAAEFVGKVAPGLIKVYKQSGLDGFLRNDGTVLTQYSRLDKKYVADASWRFDNTASKLASIPDEWNKPGATWGERRAYKKALERFDAAKAVYLNQLLQGAHTEGIPNPQAYAAETVSSMETMVKTMRLFSSDPKTLDRLEAIGKNPSWLRGLKDAAFERTIGTTAGYVATAGRAARIGTVALTGVGSLAAVAAAPIIAGVVGAFRGNARAKKELRENDRLARSGDGTHVDVSDQMRIERERITNGKALSKDELKNVDAHMVRFYATLTKSQTQHRMSDVSRKISQLTNTQEALEQAKNIEDRANLLVKIKTYADFIEAKLELGQVNFGSGDEQVVRQYELMRALHEARVAIETQKEMPLLAEALVVYENDPASLRTRTISFGSRLQEKAEKARKQKILIQTRNGVTLGALAGTAGVAARWFGEYVGWFGDHPAPVEHHEAPVKISHTQADTAVKFSDTHSVEGKGKTFNAPLPKSDIHEAIPQTAAQVKFSSKGIQQTLLNFRHSAEFKNLSPDQQKFFEGNVVKISKEIKGFRPGTLDGKESISFSEGSQFGVTADGRVFVADKLSGKTTILGHLEGSSFKPDANEADLKYIDTDAQNAAPVVKKTFHTNSENALPKKPSALPRVKVITKENLPEADTLKAEPIEPVKLKPAESAVVESQPVAPASTEDLRSHLVPSPTYDTVTRTFREMRDTLGTSLRDYTPGQEFSPRMRVEMDSLSSVVLEKTADRYFSYASPSNPLATVAGHNSPAWLSFSSRSAKEVIATELTAYNTQFRPFFQELKNMAEKYPMLSKEQPLGSYLKKIYRTLIEEEVRSQAAKK